MINFTAGVPFAQIANTALRDTRLSFKARGILAMALSNSGEWEATRDYFEAGSDKDGREAVQSGLNELTALGYRVVEKRRRVDGTFDTVVHWFHEPQIDRPTGNPTVGEADGPKNTILKNTKNTPSPMLDDQFLAFWDMYPLKKDRGAAERAWKKLSPPDRLLAIKAAAAYRDDPDRVTRYTKYPATWLNAASYLDAEPAPLNVVDHSSPSAYDSFFCPVCGRPNVLEKCGCEISA